MKMSTRVIRKNRKNSRAKAASNSIFLNRVFVCVFGQMSLLFSILNYIDYTKEYLVRALAESGEVQET
jgi:hypothetical protein